MGEEVATGVFGEHMHIDMSADGPVMIIVEKNNQEINENK